MMYLSKSNPGAMEFTKFSKLPEVQDEDFIAAAMQFEKSYLREQKGVICHFLLRNLKGEYANLLFADNIASLKNLEAGAEHNDAANTFFKQINFDSVKIYFHEILKKDFQVPENFACFEHGTFKVKKGESYSQQSILSRSQKLEEEYLNTFENSVAHFIGKLDEETYSDIVFGKTLGKTKEVCFGYLQTLVGQQFLEIMVPDTADLDFWYLIG